MYNISKITSYILPLSKQSKLYNLNETRANMLISHNLHNKFKKKICCKHIYFRKKYYSNKMNEKIHIMNVI